TSIAMGAAMGTSWRSISSRLAPRSPDTKLTPVTLPPGRLRLGTSPATTGSLPGRDELAPLHSIKLHLQPQPGTPSQHTALASIKSGACRTARFRPTCCPSRVKFRHCSDVRCTTALPPKAEVQRRSCHVAQVLGSDICTAAILCLFDHLVGEREQVVGDLEAERLRGLEVDHRLEPGRLPHRQVGRPSALENLRGVDAVLAIDVW